MVCAFAARADAATTAMFASAPDAKLKDLELTNLTLATVIYGTVRNAFERGLAGQDVDLLRRNLADMCRAYLSVVSD